MLIIFLKKNKSFHFLKFKKQTKKFGRSYGKIIIRHRGGGFKYLYRSIDFYRSLWNIYGLVLNIEYNPIHNKLISLIFYLNGILSYILYIKGLVVGAFVYSSYKTKIKLGNACFIRNIPYGIFVHNIELRPRQGAKIARTAGNYAKILGKFDKYVLIKLKSGIKKIIIGNSLAVIGVISDYIYLYKLFFQNAGSSRNIGWRPSVRGVAMNCVDHPNGGGKGKKSCKSISMSPWKKFPKGKKTAV